MILCARVCVPVSLIVSVLASLSVFSIDYVFGWVCCVSMGLFIGVFGCLFVV